VAFRVVATDQLEWITPGALSMYVGDPLERQNVGAGGLIHVEPGTLSVRDNSCQA